MIYFYSAGKRKNVCSFFYFHFFKVKCCHLGCILPLASCEKYYFYKLETKGYIDFKFGKLGKLVVKGESACKHH